jgi:hypothetical protein
MMTTRDSLTEREQQGLEHLQKAQELGRTVVDYASAAGLKVTELYEMKRRLVRKGLLGEPNRRKRKPADKRGKADAFATVRIVPSAPPVTAVSCRLVHPSGWVLECAGFPPADWMTTVVMGGMYAST